MQGGCDGSFESAFSSGIFVCSIRGFDNSGLDGARNKVSCSTIKASQDVLTMLMDSGSGVKVGRYIIEGTIASSKTLPNPVCVRT